MFNVTSRHDEKTIFSGLTLVEAMKAAETLDQNACDYVIHEINEPIWNGKANNTQESWSNL